MGGRSRVQVKQTCLDSCVRRAVRALSVGAHGGEGIENKRWGEVACVSAGGPAARTDGHRGRGVRTPKR